MSSASIPIGELVVDGDDPEGDVATVVNKPPVPCSEWEVTGGHTVASYPGNEPYPNDSPVVVVAFTEELNGERPDFNGSPVSLSELQEKGVNTFAFPPERLELAEEATDPPEELLDLQNRLDSNAETEIDISCNPPVLRVAKPSIDEEYCVTPAGDVQGDGALRGRLEAVVDEVMGR
jgi:hypothetical protein